MTEIDPTMGSVEVNTQEAAEPIKLVSDHLPGGPVAPAHGIAALALSLAVKYHDVSTIKDGALYQQYKLEGRNIVPLHLDMVFETAIRMEAWLLGASDRIAKIIVDALEVKIEDDPPADAQGSEASESP